MRNGLTKDLIARVLGGAPKYTIADLEKMYPPRDLPDGAMVSRFAPSPTGFMHIGNLYGMLIDKKLAQQSRGVFFLRIEDTDTKRAVDGAVDVILNAAKAFGLDPNEGPEAGGAYGPYVQSERRDIYHAAAADLLERGLAYPCFLTSEETEKIRADQKTAGLPTGIYGQWARWRNAQEEEITAQLDAGKNPSIRLWSFGSKDRRIFCRDAARGSIAFPENDEDIVLIKSADGLPTYHFAHLVDDHFMRTTHVVRSDEWLPSLPLHYQLFEMMAWTPPAYVHTSTLDTLDAETGNQRKLSKRKDPFATLSYFPAAGYPAEAVLEYLYNIADSSYEDAKTNENAGSVWDAEMRVKKIPSSGALFCQKKLDWWSREFISKLSVKELSHRIVEWAEKSGMEIDRAHVADRDYLKTILSIERDNPKHIRKDFITWKQTLEEIAYFFDDVFDGVSGATHPSVGEGGGGGFRLGGDRASVLQNFIRSFDSKDPKDIWWKKIQAFAATLGIKSGDAAMILRVALTGRDRTPDLYSIMKAMGETRVRARIKAALE